MTFPCLSIYTLVVVHPSIRPCLRFFLPSSYHLLTLPRDMPHHVPRELYQTHELIFIDWSGHQSVAKAGCQRNYGSFAFSSPLPFSVWTPLPPSSTHPLISYHVFLSFLSFFSLWFLIIKPFQFFFHPPTILSNIHLPIPRCFTNDENNSQQARKNQSTKFFR